MLTEQQKESMPEHMLYFINIVPNMKEQTYLIENMLRKMEGLNYRMVGVTEHKVSFSYIYYFYKNKEK